MRLAQILFCLVALQATAAEFLRAEKPRPFEFPRDHASHAGYQTEWWYVTGTVEDDAGSAFGYQFTIFRRSVDPRNSAARGRKSAWAMNDFYVGHAAISDISAKAFHCEEIFGRGATGIAGATDASDVRANEPIRVWLADWEIATTTDGTGWRVRARFGKHALDLTLTQRGPIFLNGKADEPGLSRKGGGVGQASYYYSVPRLETRGTLTVDGLARTIRSGNSWLDREWGSNQLSKDQAGWDWFALHLDDGSALMLYVLRNSDGTIEAASSGMFYGADGQQTYLALSDLQFTRGRTWTSPHSGGIYTLEWKIEIPRLNLALNVAAAQEDQEIKSTRFSKIFYYEGAVRVSGTRAGRPVRGDGYLEITGAPGQKGTRRGLGGVL